MVSGSPNIRWRASARAGYASRVRSVSGVLLLALASTAHADDNSARASKLFDEGRALAGAGKLTEACSKFEESFKLDAQTGTEVNWADCLEKTGKLRAAWMQFDAAAIESLRAGNSVRAKFARDRADKLEGKLAQVVLHVAEPTMPGMTIQVGDHYLPPSAEVRDHVEPGDIAVTITAPKHGDFHTALHASAGATLVVEVILELDPYLKPQQAPAKPDSYPIASTVPPPSGTPTAAGEPLGVSATTPAYEMQRDPGRVHIAYALGGASIVTGLTGLGIAIYAKHAYDDAVKQNDISKANHEVHVSDVGTGFAVASVAFGAAAAIVYFTAPRERVVVTPSASSTSASLTVFARF